MNRESQSFKKESEKRRLNERVKNASDGARLSTPPSSQESEEKQNANSGVFLSVPKEAVPEFSLDVIQESFEVLHLWIATFSGIREYVWSGENGSFILFLPQICAEELLSLYAERFPEMTMLKEGGEKP